MKKKKNRFKDSLTKRFKTQLAKAEKQLSLAKKFDPEGLESRTLNAISKLRICLDFMDLGKMKKKDKKALNKIDVILRGVQRLLAALNAYDVSSNKLKNLFPKGSDNEKFKAAIMDLVALESRAVNAESMIKINSIDAIGSLQALKKMAARGNISWISQKEVRRKLKALDMLMKKQRKAYEASYAGFGPLHPTTIQAARQCSGSLNAAIDSYSLLYRAGIKINTGKVRKYRRVEKRVNNFLRSKDVNTFIRRFQSNYGSLSNEQLTALLTASEKKINEGFVFKNSQKTTLKTPDHKKRVDPVKKTVTVNKSTTVVPKTTARRGRPKKTTTVSKTTTVKPKTTARRGRPKKTTTVSKTTTVKPKTTARRGRPKKTTTNQPKTPAKRGRPKKIQPDDLTLIKGIGPALEKALNSAGIVSFAQLASLTEADHLKLDKMVSRFHGRARRAGWARQATELMKK